MKRYIVRQVLITRLAALALSALCFLQAPVRAQETTYNVIFPSVGLAHDQILSFTLFNPNGVPVRAQSYLAFPGFTGGVTVASGDINGDAFRSFNIKRSDIPQAGEAGTGRIQLSLSVRLSSSEAIKPVVASMEIISISDGTSNTFFIGEKPPSQDGGSGNDFLKSGFGNDVMMGIPHNKRLRVTLTNPSASGERVSGHVKVFNGAGGLLAQSPELVIPPGEFRSFDFNRDALPILGEPGTNRAQVRIKPFFTFESQRLPALPGDDVLLTNVISFEVIDNSTGKTVAMAGHQCLVFFLGGMPSN